MDAASLLLTVVAAIVAGTVFALMRYPRFRRAQFRGYPACSLRASVLGAVAVVLTFVLLVALNRG